MNYLQSLFLGLVEGITEYLPISSTFHLIWASRLMHIPQTDFQKAYEVIIQGGAILAVAILYWKTFIDNRKLVKKVIYSFIPTAVLGLLLYKIIKGAFFDSYIIQIIVFAVIGLFFILYEFYNEKLKLNKTLDEFTYKDAIIIGLVQVLAVFPGVSRAGAVIVGMMLLGVRRDEAAKYSFLLAVPTLLAASSLDLYKSLPTLIAHPEYSGLLFVGFIMSFVSALFVVKWFIKFLQHHTLITFGVYRLLVATVLLLMIFA